ncbi:DUF4355 domain-containing protein [Clostridium sp. UBA1056]|uniref:DUF4355 domain-containing protein n=1 Tax=unclassified Clostridium TaxID=2614128 RepID=UPI003216A924
MNKKLLINLGLCGRGVMFMAPDAGGSTGNGDTGTDTIGTEGTEASGDEQNGTKSFDDVLKDKSYQSEFDKRISKALETAKSKWEADYNSKLETAKTEAEKLAKMNADEKAKYAEEKRIAELVKREKDITTRELKTQAYETLAEKGILGDTAKEITEVLNYNDAETCSKSIDAIVKAINSGIERGVNEKLRGGLPPKSGQGNNNQSTFGFNFTGVRGKK